MAVNVHGSGTQMDPCWNWVEDLEPGFMLLKQEHLIMY